MSELLISDGDAARLRLSRCRNCGSVWFPPRQDCAVCLSRELTQFESAEVGEVYSSTLVQTGAPGFGDSYVLAYVDVDGARALMRIEGATDALAPGTEVRFVPGWTSGERSGPYAATTLDGS